MDELLNEVGYLGAAVAAFVGAFSTFEFMKSQERWQHIWRFLALMCGGLLFTSDALLWHHIGDQMRDKNVGLPWYLFFCDAMAVASALTMAAFAHSHAQSLKDLGPRLISCLVATAFYFGWTLVYWIAFTLTQSPDGSFYTIVANVWPGISTPLPLCFYGLGLVACLLGAYLLRRPKTWGWPAAAGLLAACAIFHSFVVRGPEGWYMVGLIVLTCASCAFYQWALPGLLKSKKDN